MDTNRTSFASFDRGCSAEAVSMLVAALAAVICVCGCGSRGPERFQLMGAVTFDGKPVPIGTIRFEADATQGNNGPVGYAMIENGRYTTAAQGSKGALKGPLVVIMTGGPASDPNAGLPVLWFTNYSTTITLEPKGGITTFDFDVPRSKR